MINSVYCCIYFLLIIVSCQSNFINDEDYTNDSPYTSQKIEEFRHKIGSDVTMKCNLDHLNKEDIIWEFKPCESNYKGLQCNPHNLHKINENAWRTLDFMRGRKKLEIKNSSEIHNGLYRCVHNESIKKIYMLEIIDPNKYEGPPPEVVSLKQTNSTILQNMNFVIQCKVTSLIPPTILWFKECNGHRCDIREMNHCFCHINTTNTMYSSGNIYLSKINVYNSRTIDGGIYACLAVSLFGKDYKSVTVKVVNFDDENTQKNLPLLFLIPLTLILIPITVWLCYFRKKKKNVRAITTDQNKQLIKPVMQVDIVRNRNQII